MKRIGLFSRALAACFAVVFLSGCNSVEVESKVDPRLTYQKVYFQNIKGKDKLHIQAMVSERLKRTGFDVINVKEGEAPRERQGTGFILTTNAQFLTCAHVVAGQTDATAWIGGRRFTGRVTAIDTNLDLALVQIDGNPHGLRPLPVRADAKYRLGEDVYTMGFPLADQLGFSPRLTKGILSATVGMRDNTNHVQISAEVQSGNSGGPLLDEHGSVIGVVQATLNPLNVLMRTGGSLPQNVNFAVNSGAVAEFLKNAGIELPPAGTETATNDFATAKDSMVLVRSGTVTDEELKASTLFCLCGYTYQDDIFFPQLRMVTLKLFDGQSGRQVISAVGIRKNEYASFESFLDQMFEKIYGGFFPERPNPFARK